MACGIDLVDQVCVNKAIGGIPIKLLFIGDIVGSVGRKALKNVLPGLKSKYRPDVVLVNGENAAHGRGINQAIAREFFDQGVHGITMGNHTWDNREIFDFIDDEPRLIRPANFPYGTPGNGYMSLKAAGKDLLVINLQGRTFLPPLDCPFQTVDAILEREGGRHQYIFVDFHAEATSEKIAMGWYLNGRVSAVVGTHTHVQSNDNRVLPGGTAYLTDVGMVGPRDGILGMEQEGVMHRFLTQMPSRFVVDEGKWHFHAALIELDEQTGLAKSIQQIRTDEDNYISE